MTGRETNWAGNITYQAGQIHAPATRDELRRVVAGAAQIRALGSRHSFNELADQPAGDLVSLSALPHLVEVDSATHTARVAAGMRYAELAPHLDKQGFALANLGSLPHISVAGACATGTHGSGARIGNLATAVAAVELVTAEGDLVTLTRDQDPDFPGAVVALGALGVVVGLTLDIVPTFDLRQRIYEYLSLDELADGHFATLLSSAYSVGLFTDWSGEGRFQAWFNQRVGDPELSVLDESWFTAIPADGPRHPIPGLDTVNCTEQLGVPGRWYERLPHFRPEFTPSNGDELQSEFMVPAEHAVPALRALAEIRAHLRPVLQTCEIRAVAADRLWLSECHDRDTVCLHFTWTSDTAAVVPVVTRVEQSLAPFDPRPHWAKVFTVAPDQIRAGYPKLADFRALATRLDPTGKFRNPFTDRYLYDTAS